MIKIGLIGAGAWAQHTYAPLFADNEVTELAGVWARTPAGAALLAARHRARAFDTVSELARCVDALAFAVPPAAQATIAIEAAGWRRPMLLEKPLAATVDGARGVVAALAANDVRSMMGLAYRFAPGVERFIDEARRIEAIGLEARFLSGGFLSGPFASGWRRDVGALVDVGPHVLDLVDLALGEIRTIHGVCRPDWASLACEHVSEAVSTVTLSCSVHTDGLRVELEAHGSAKAARIDVADALGPFFSGPRFAPARSAALRRLRDEFAALVSGQHLPDRMSAARGLYLQGLIADAMSV